MNRSQQEFTFINVNAGKKSNTRTIKRHVSNQTNRRKRQEAVKQYQDSLLEAVQQHTSSDQSTSTSPESQDYNQHVVVLRPKDTESSPDLSASPEEDDDYEEFASLRQLIGRRPDELVDYWPTYQRWAMRNLKTHSPLPRKPLSNSSLARSSTSRWKLSPDSSPSRILLTLSDQHVTVHIPRINDPSEFSRIQWALKTCEDFVHGMYDDVWAADWQGKQWFQGTFIPLGIWRESFPLAVEFIEAGKMKEAFLILNAALNVTPAFFKQSHPGLLIALLGAMMYTCQISDKRLSNLIRTHVTQLSMAYLGPRHPISMLLREQMRAADTAAGRTDLLAAAVIDVFADCFGPTHFVPLSMRFGFVRRQLTSGDFDGALAGVAILQKAWNEDVMPGAQLPKFLAFEKAKVLNAQQRAQHPGLNSKENVKHDLSEVANASVQLPVFVPGKGPTLQPMNSAILKKLGKHLLFGSHYALAMHIYTRIPEIFAPSAITTVESTTNQDPEKFPTIVARILLDHLKGEMKRET